MGQTHRSGLDICSDILQNVEYEGKLLTRLLASANLSYAQGLHYIKLLLEAGLLKRQEPIAVYSATIQGHHFVAGHKALLKTLYGS